MRSPDFRPLTTAELDTVLDWAAAEGWNPGLEDAAAFRMADPEAFWGLERAGKLVAGGAITAYAETMGFMGLFIVHPDWRGRGLGREFWYFRRDKLVSRLKPGAPIAMDGVFAMQHFYARGGFVFTHRHLRMAGVGIAAPRSADLVELHSVPFAWVENFDRAHFGAPRPDFLRRWIFPAGGLGLGVVRGEALAGMGVIRPSRSGFKIGPLFARDASLAETIFRGLSAHAAGQPLFLDIPEVNPDAVTLAARHGLQESFGCARMVFGPVPDLPWSSIYGVTTLELG